MLDTSIYGPVNANRNDIDSDFFHNENKKEEQNEKEMKANDKQKLDNNGENKNAPLLRFTKKGSLLIFDDHFQM